MSKKEFFPPRPLSEVVFSGLKDVQEFLSLYLVNPKNSVNPD